MGRSAIGLVSAFALSLGLIACGDDDNGGDECEGLSNLCTVAGTSCDGNRIVTCAEDANGCLVQTVDQDCSTNGEQCDDSGAAPVCTSTCTDDTECAGASDGDKLCVGDEIISCDLGAAGCLVATVDEDCAANGDLCDDSGAEPVCVPACTDDAACTGLSDGDTFCSSDVVVSCNLSAQGCLVANPSSDCTVFGQTCDDSGAQAVCAAGACSDHPLCAGRTDGETFCSGLTLNTCTTGASGCLEVSQTNCSPGSCDETGTAACVVATATGEDCSDPYPITSAGYVANIDLSTFGDDVSATDGSCVQTQAGTSPDVVFSATLQAGQTIHVSELGGLDAIVNLQTGTCGSAEMCVAGFDNLDTDRVSYTAAANETVFIVVESWATSPGATDAVVQVAIDPTCGDGIVEGDEQCDDGDGNDADGCSASCAVEFGYRCDTFSPSTCTAIPSLGSFAAGDPIIPVTNANNLPADYIDTFMITFTEAVNLSGTLTAAGGDPDFYLINSANQTVLSAAAVGDESFGGYVPAGTYMIFVLMYETASSGYVLSLATTPLNDGGSVGDGGALSFSGGPLTAGDSVFYQVTVTEDVLLTFDLTSDDGATSDMDFYVYGADGFVTGVADDFDELGVTVALKAGSYVFQINAWSGASDATTWSFDATAAALQVSSIGSFGAGDPINNTVGGPVTARDYEHHMVTFTEPVLLSGTLGGNTTGAVGIRIYDENRAFVSSFTGGDESFTDVALPAGTYVVQVLTASTALGGGDVDAYTLTLSTTAVP